MSEQEAPPPSDQHHDPKVISRWIAICFVAGFGVGYLTGNAVCGALIGIPVGLAIGWIRGAPAK